VSGLILFAKNARSHKLLNEQFGSRAIIKKYLALVSGTPSETSGIIKKPIKQFGSGRMGVDRSGKESITNYKVINSFGNYSLIELNPSTSRRHQLRVHLYSIGFPIIGDLRYGDKEFQKQFQRLMLHANSIEFTTPDGTRKYIEAELPVSFTRQIELFK
jgi:tRNA pseudouridine32 synthase / 23S rRNA pseudouridine746 synthase